MTYPDPCPLTTAKNTITYHNWQLLHSVIAKYRDLSVASRSVIQLRQIIDLRDTDKSWYFAITEFNNCSIIWSPSLFFKEHLREAKRSAIFRQERSKKEKSVVSSRIVLAAKNSWTTLRMSTPLFVGIYLQVTWWALGQWKGRNNCIEW